MKPFVSTLLLLCCAPAAAQSSVQPLWFDRIKQEDQSGLVQRCSRRGDVAPRQGQRCSKKSKLCYFGTQDCDEVGPHPETMCFCDGQTGSRTWDCQNATCPVTFDQNVSACPTDDPPGIAVGCTTDLRCTYESTTSTLPDGPTCFETSTCSCNSPGNFVCQTTSITCVSGPPSITGICPEDPPKINVGCESDLECSYTSTSTLPDGSPCTEDTTCVCTSPGNFACDKPVVSCVSNDPPSITDTCPDDPPGLNAGCTTDLVCPYEVSEDFPDGSTCTEASTCSCTFPGNFECEPTAFDCVPTDPPSITDVCPEDQPRINVGCTTDLDCTYESTSTLPDGATCNDTNRCRCTFPGNFSCQTTRRSCRAGTPP